MADETRQQNPLHERARSFTFAVRNHRWFMAIMKCFVCFPVRLRYHLHAENRELLKQVKPPYILLPNHTHLFDPFFLTYFSRDPIFFVTRDSVFRNKFISYWIRQYGAIPKSRAIPDIETIDHIMQVIKNGDILGLYCEGQQTWDGVSLPPLDSTAKLLRLLKAPVIRVQTRGAFLARPRWAANRRKGRVTISYKLILTADDLKHKRLSEIKRIIEEEIAYNEWEWMEGQDRIYNNLVGCKNMEKALYTCPHCKTIGQMKGSWCYLYCKSCGYTVRYTARGLFALPRGKRHPVYFTNMHEWNVWQREHLAQVLREHSATGSAESLMANNVVLWTGYRMNPMKKYARGRIFLYADRLVFVADERRGGKTKESLSFDLKVIDGLSFMRASLEFYYERTLYRFKFLVSSASSLKWSTAIGILQGK